MRVGCRIGVEVVGALDKKPTTWTDIDHWQWGIVVDWLSIRIEQFYV